MANIKCTWFFKHSTPQTQPSGWSESLINLTAADVPAALDEARTLAFVRARMLGGYVTLPYIRASRLGVRGDSRVEPGIPSVAGPPERATGASVNPCDIPQATVMLRMEAVDPLFIARRTFHMHGSPDKVHDVILDPMHQDAAWNAAFTTWKNLLVSGTWGMMALDRTVANPAVNVVDVNVAPPHLITTAGNHGFVVGDLVVATRIGAEPRNVSGVFQVASVPSPTTLTFLLFPAITAYTGGGELRKNSRVQVAFSSVNYRRLGTRKVGRPFDVAHGITRIPA